MANHEQAVRDAALALQNAIADAIADGYRVNWPGNAAALDKIEISSTANVEEEKLEKLPQPVDPKRRRPTPPPLIQPAPGESTFGSKDI